MAPLRRKLVAPPCSVICHGLCEIKIVEHFRSTLRTGIRDFSRNAGRSSLEVQNLVDQLTGIPGLKNEKDFCRCYKLEVHERKQFLANHKIFLLMDKDAAPDSLWKSYKNGSLFRGLWIEPYVVPIYFEPDFDTVSSSAGFAIDKERHKPDQVQKYLLSRPDYLRALAAKKSLTNLHVLLDYLKDKGFDV